MLISLVECPADSKVSVTIRNISILVRNRRKEAFCAFPNHCIIDLECGFTVNKERF